MRSKKDWIWPMTVILQEDLHSGSGSGDMFIDSHFYRDEKGIPVIDGDHFRGVLRDNGLRLLALGLADEDQLNQLFGISGGIRRLLEVSSLRPTDGDQIETLIWESTARQTGSRLPEDTSLRSIEFLPAGTILQGTIKLLNLDDDRSMLCDLLERILKITCRLGGERTRGSGAINFAKIAKEQLKEKDDNRKVPEKTECLRLMLCSEEPLCLPITGHAGNNIRSESFISGRSLQSAMATFAHERGEDLKSLLTTDISFGNGYPFPLDKLGVSSLFDLVKVTSIPFPGHLFTRKNRSGSGHISIPHWLHETGNPCPLNLSNLVSRFNEMDGEITPGSRPKGALYLVKGIDGQAYRYEQPMGLRMKTRRGEPLADLRKKDLDLFTMERLPAGTCFITDIVGRKKELEKINNLLRPWFSGSHTIGIGRGRAPLSVMEYDYLQASPHISTYLPDKYDDSFLLLLTSDWILRGENLGFLDTITIESLCDQLNLFPEDRDPYKKLTIRAFASTVERGAFNFASNLPRPPVTAIRQGSVFKISGAAAGEMARLLSGKTAFGERCSEGYGRYLINPEIELTSSTSTETEEKSQEPSTLPENILETATRAAQEFLAQINIGSGKLPSCQQLHSLLNQLIVIQRGGDKRNVEDVLNVYKESSHKQGQMNWKTLLEGPNHLAQEFSGKTIGFCVQYIRTVTLLLAREEENKEQQGRGSHNG